MDHPRRFSRRVAVVAFGIILLLAACTSTSPSLAPEITEPVARGSTILLLRPEIACHEVQTGGRLARPDWTARAEASVQAALDGYMRERETTLVAFDPVSFSPEERAAQEAAVQSLTRLGLARTPETSRNVMLNPLELAPLRDAYGADYALAIFLEESYQSLSHIAMRYSLGMIFGPVWAPMPATGQSGFASLTDLETGKVVWSNVIATPGETLTDIRDPAKARRAIDKLMQDCPI